jgi:hypothetical protein
MPASSDGYVLLRGGLTVPVAPLLLLFELEGRGLTLTVDGDALLVRPASCLTEEDCRRIRRWKPHLLALVSYQAPAIM